MPKVSVVVPIYNTEEWLPACLDALLAQTVKDIEIIAVDNGTIGKYVMSCFVTMCCLLRGRERKNGFPRFSRCRLQNSKHCRQTNI